MRCQKEPRPKNEIKNKLRDRKLNKNDSASRGIRYFAGLAGGNSEGMDCPIQIPVDQLGYRPVKRRRFPTLGGQARQLKPDIIKSDAHVSQLRYVPLKDLNSRHCTPGQKSCAKERTRSQKAIILLKRWH
jgi:hypothetical protein